MDDDLHSLESELKRLPPAAPSRELADRIDRELASADRPRARAPLPWRWFAALPAAAALAFVLAPFARRAPPSPATPPAVTTGEAVAGPRTLTVTHATAATSDAPLKPVAAENVLVSAADEGLVTLDDGTRARRERLHYVDTITWRNPQTHASLTWRVPREEVRVVPVNFQ